MEEEKVKEILKKIKEENISLHKIEEIFKISSNDATNIRRLFLENAYNVKLENIAHYSIDFDDAVNRNIENPIGVAQLPLGYAGSIKINGSFAKGSYPVLLATTEGKLVASVSRGISIFNGSGGANTEIVKEGITRDVLISTSGIKDAIRLMKLANEDPSIKIIEEAFSESNKYIKLKEVKPFILGKYLHLRFSASTGAAMGMNMVTIAAKAAVDKFIPYANSKLGINARLLSESGNMCTDKKPAIINMVEGRGISVVADGIISKQVLANFGLEAGEIANVNKAKNLLGSAMAGSNGFNAHVANVLAAMYIAYGQDAAQIVEGTQAITDAQDVNGDLYISLTMPSIEVGTIGGGTKRETQNESLRLMGLYGENDKEGITKKAFAEVVAGTCLAAELNILIAQTKLDLSKSHASIKRG
ncbi:MAG: hydroxymethylglutaryl-CoA reductase [Candidatus Micrarchaeia archaeon]